MYRNMQRILFLITLSVFCISCMGPNITIKSDTVYEQTIAEMDGEYLLGPGDVVEIIYHVEPQPSEKEYIFAVGDVVRVEFYYHPEINRDVSIRTDGKISLPLKGNIDATGLTPSGLREKLIRLYGDTFKDPDITITPVEYNQAIKQLKEAFSTSSRGQSKLSAIRPDGYISFPLLGDMMGTGLTLPQLKERLTTEYSKIINNLSVSLILEQIKSNLVYVMGEVRAPGYYLMESPTTATQILARAGGLLNSAKTNNILVVSSNKERKPVGRLIDLDKILGEGNIGNDIVLKQYDVVYVPKSAIAKVDLFIDQYINQLIPRIFRVNLSFGYDIHREVAED